MNVISDLDGTLCNTPPGIDYDDPEQLLARCTPRLEVLQRFTALHPEHRLSVVTARGRHVAHASRQQLQAWLPALGEDLRVYHRPRLLFDARHWVNDKAAQIRQLEGRVYIGDRPEDRAAALRAGARFLWDWEFEAHGLGRLVV
jgi:phosphoglycolate phosphatase-like HAD superfamily hydrolase